MRVGLLAVLTALLVVSSAVAQQEEQTAPPAPQHGAMLVDEAFVRAMNANNLDGMVLLYAPEAVLYPPEAPEARGRDAIRETFARMLDQFTVDRLELIDSSYESQGTLSVGYGRFTLSMTPRQGGEPIRSEGRFTSVVKNIDGKWFYVADHVSFPLPPSPGEQDAPSERPFPGTAAPPSTVPPPAPTAGPVGIGAAR